MLAAASLYFASLSSAQETPLGVVLQANQAHVRQSALTQGTSIFTGEEISTEDGGSTDIRIANSRFSLAEDSHSRFYPPHGSKGSVVELRSGTITFRREAGDTTEIYAEDVRITPHGDGPVTGVVTIDSPCKIDVTAVSGDLEVFAGKESHVINEREQYEVHPKESVESSTESISPEDDAYHRPHTHKVCVVPRLANGSPSQFSKIGIIAGAAGAGVVALLLMHQSGKSTTTSTSPGGGTESPDKP